MTIFRDKHLKGYLLFIIVYSALMIGVVICFCQSQVSVTKSMYLEHDTAVVSSLLEQGVSEEIIATAISNTTTDKDGIELLSKIGISANTLSSLLPFLSQFQSHTFRILLTGTMVLIFLLCAGTLFFLWVRNRLYLQAQNIVGCYINGDYFNH